MQLGDPDTFVQWNRTDEPGENPRWESQCGVVEQIGFGDKTAFRGFVGPDRVPQQAKSTLAVVKRDVQREFVRTEKLVFAYEA